MKRLILLSAFALALPCAAQSVPATLNYQGRLTDNTPQQAPLTATVAMSFELWDCAACATPAPDRLWAEPAAGTVPVAVTGGIFNVQLGGNGVALPAAVFSGGSQRWLQIYVNGEALSPRQLLTAAAYANQAENAASAASAATAITATSADNANNLGGVAAGGYQLATVQNCGAGQFLSAIGNGSASCGTPASSVPNPLTLIQASGAVTITGINTGAGPGLLGQSAAQNGVIGRSASSSDSGVYGENNGAGTGVAGATDSNTADGVMGVNYGAGPAVHGLAIGAGPAGKFEVTSAASSGPAITASTAGTGSGLEVTAAGGGAGVNASATGGYGAAVKGVNNGFGPAGLFQQNNPANVSPAVSATTAGSGPGLYAASGDGGSGVWAEIASGNGSAVYGGTQGSGHGGFFEVYAPAGTGAALEARNQGAGPVARFFSLNVLSTPLQVDANYPAQTAKLTRWTVGGTEVASVSPAGMFTGNGAGLTQLDPGNIASGLANISITGNAATVSNGVSTTGSYANPVWITSLAGAKITGTVAQATNAATATSATSATTAVNATNAANAAQLGGVAAAGYQLATVQSCGAGQFLSAITNGSASCASPAANNLAPPVFLSYGGPGAVLTLNNTGGTGLSGTSSTGYGVSGQGNNPGSVGVFGVYGGGTISVMQNSGVSGFSGVGTGTAGISISGTGVSGTATGAGIGVSGTSLGTGNAGLFQINNAASAAAAVSVNTNGTGDGINSFSAGHNGVAALSASATDSGVYGANTGLGRAGFFQISSAASTAEGVLAATAGSGPGVAGTSTGGDGIQGFTASTTHSGVYGEGSATSGVNYGVYGYTRSASGVGVLGNSTGGAEGVYGLSANNNGVHGASNASNGVYGSSNLSNGVAGNAAGAGQAGVFGTNSSAASGFGVYGSVTTGQAVFGYASASGWGVHGQSAGGRGVFGESVSDAGVYGYSSGASGAAGDGVAGVTNSPAAAGVHAKGSGPSGTALLVENGGIRVAGAGAGSATPAFIQVSAAGNISGDATIITNPLTDGDPNAILIVTHNYNPGGTGGFVLNKPFGVFYTSGHWRIYLEDISAMPAGVSFNVLVIKP